MAITYQPLISPWPTEFGDKLPVSELFYSLQGEGRFAGWPAVFIRLKYCNLGCSWCDTRFTWDVDKIETGALMTAEQIGNKVMTLLPPDISPSRVHVVITGGEPMLHQDRIPSLVDELKKHGLSFFELETNGMFVPNDEMTSRISWWNCSPKLSNNGLPIEQNIVPEAIRAIASIGKVDFKFVVRNDDDINEIQTHYLPLIQNSSSIMLMAEGTTARKQIEMMPFVIEACMKHGFRFSPRLHILNWGNERGK